MHLLIGFDNVAIVDGGWLSVMGRVWPMLLVECVPVAEASLDLGFSFQGMHIDALIFRDPAQGFNEDVVEVAGLAAHLVFDPTV